MSANRVSQEVLEDRNLFSTEDAKAYNLSRRPAYSMANWFCGAGIDTFCGIKELFKSDYAVDSDEASRVIYKKLTGMTAFASVQDAMGGTKRSNKPVALLVLTPPCPDFSTGNPNPRGTHGHNGGHLVSEIPEIIKAVNPLVVFIEQVANMVNFEEDCLELFTGLHQLDMTVHAAVVSMSQYGDIENC